VQNIKTFVAKVEPATFVWHVPKNVNSLPFRCELKSLRTPDAIVDVKYEVNFFCFRNEKKTSRLQTQLHILIGSWLSSLVRIRRIAYRYSYMRAILLLGRSQFVRMQDTRGFVAFAFE
jgi:hypothetical protein